MQYLQESVRPSTRSTYASHVNVYHQYWESTKQAGNPFPVKTESLTKFAIYLAEQRELTPASIKQHISAVKHHNALVNMDEDQQLGLVMRGIQNRNLTIRGPTPVRPIWDSSDTLRAAELLENLARQRGSSLADMQGLCTVVIAFLCAQRAASIADARYADIKFTGVTFCFEQRTAKSKQPDVTQQFRIPWKNCKPLSAVRTFLTKHGQSTDKYLLSEWMAFTQPSRRVHATLLRVRELLCMPQVLDQQSHSLRRGAAVAMTSIGVPFHRVLSWGGWKDASSLKPYIEGREWCAGTQHHEQCFGWMKQGMAGDNDMGQQITARPVQSRT